MIHQVKCYLFDFHCHLLMNENRKDNILLDESLNTLLPLLDRYLMIGNNDKKINGQINLETKIRKGTIQMQKMKDLFKNNHFDNSVYENGREGRRSGRSRERGRRSVRK